MLTKNELQWLEDRELQANEDKGFYYCWHCQHYADCANGLGFALFTPCPTSDKWDKYKDAATFEARVAEMLSVIPKCRDNCTYETISHDMCRRCRIKRARNAAESEMG